MLKKLEEVISVDFDVTGQLLIKYYAFVKYLGEEANKMRQCISYLQASKMPMIQLGKRSCIIFSLSSISPCTY